MPLRVEYVSDMVQSKNAVTKDVPTKFRKEECVGDMVQSRRLQS